MRELPFLAGEHGRGPFLVVLFFLAVIVITVWGAWEGTLPADEESELAEIGREIALTGDVWTMHIAARPVYDTPPVSPLMLAFFFKLFTPNDATARLPFMLSAILILYLVYCAGELYPVKGPQEGWIDRAHATGLLAAIILASSGMFGKYSGHVTKYVPLTLFTSLSILGWFNIPGRKSGLVMWGGGIAGGILSAGAGGLLVIPAAAVASIFDSRRRGNWLRAGFISVTVLSLAAGMAWFIPAVRESGMGWSENPLWMPVNSPVDSGSLKALWSSFGTLWMKTFPWSIAVTVAFVRMLLGRKIVKREGRLTAVDYAFFSFALVLFLPAAASRQTEAGALLPVVPVLAVLAAREIARWMPRIAALWSFNQIMTAGYCFVMLLLVATPLKLHERAADPIEDVAKVAGRIVPEGESIGSFGYGGRADRARMLFYSGRSLDDPVSDPEGIRLAAEAEPGKVFVTTAEGIRRLHEADFHYRLNIVYRVGDLILFNLEG